MSDHVSVVVVESTSTQSVDAHADGGITGSAPETVHTPLIGEDAFNYGAPEYDGGYGQQIIATAAPAIEPEIDLYAPVIEHQNTTLPEALVPGIVPAAGNFPHDAEPTLPDLAPTDFLISDPIRVGDHLTLYRTWDVPPSHVHAPTWDASSHRPDPSPIELPTSDHNLASGMPPPLDTLKSQVTVSE